MVEWVLVLVLAGFLYLSHRERAKLLESWENERKEWTNERQVIIEALGRKEGQPLIFKPPAKVASPGWFDGRKSVSLKEKEQ